MFNPNTRNKLRELSVVITAVSALALSACGNSPDTSTPPKPVTSVSAEKSPGSDIDKPKDLDIEIVNNTVGRAVGIIDYLSDPEVADNPDRNNGYKMTVKTENGDNDGNWYGTTVAITQGVQGDKTLLKAEFGLETGLKRLGVNIYCDDGKERVVWLTTYPTYPEDRDPKNSTPTFWLEKNADDGYKFTPSDIKTAQMYVVAMAESLIKIADLNNTKNPANKQYLFQALDMLGSGSRPNTSAFDGSYSSLLLNSPVVKPPETQRAEAYIKTPERNDAIQNAVKDAVDRILGGNFGPTDFYNHRTKTYDTQSGAKGGVGTLQHTPDYGGDKSLWSIEMTQLPDGRFDTGSVRSIHFAPDADKYCWHKRWSAIGAV